MTLAGRLTQWLATQPAEPSLCVAFSGGGDSTALLHALATLELGERRLRAVHIDHRLHANSQQWAEQCERLCAGLGVALQVIAVDVDRSGGEGLESAARRARYAAFAQILGDGECLLLAHHRDDQAETVLLKLLRGAGPEGLAGMREQRALGRGLLCRPLLDVSREALRTYVAEHALPHIEDPSNGDPAIARGFLRSDVLPLLRRHWPQVVDSVLHSARANRAASDYLESQWRTAMIALEGTDGQTLDAKRWLTLHEALRVPLLDAWLHARGLAAPTTAQRLQLERQIVEAGQDRVPCIRYGQTELYLWRGAIHPQRKPAELDPDWEIAWHGEQIALPGAGSLACPASSSFPRPLTVRLRRGGERLKPAGDAHTRELRDLFQARALPPWLRSRCPMVYDGEDLIAVGDRWFSAAGVAFFDAIGAKPRWNSAND